LIIDQFYWPLVFKKILAKIIKNKLKKFIELDYLIPKSQYEFRKEKSCEDCIGLVNLKIYRTFMSGKFIALFLDIKTVYDNVNPFILFDAINSLRIPLWDIRYSLEIY